MKKAKLMGAILGVVLFIIVIAGITYAWYTWRSENISISGNTKCFNVNYTKGQTLSGESAILFDESKIINNNQIIIKNGMAITNVTASIDASCDLQGQITLELTTSELNNTFTTAGTSNGAFKYVLASYDPNTYKDITTNALKEQKFDIIKKDSITSTSSIELITESLSTTSKGYLLVFYVDGDLVTNDAQDTTFTATIAAKVKQIAE